jgi:hypothetical protein
MAAFKLSDWNDILTQINTVSASPPEGYSALAPLPLVADPHRWSVADITAVRARLQAICSTNGFSAPLTLWSQAILDEINAAIGNGWCGPAVLTIGIEAGQYAEGFTGHLTNIYCSDPTHYRVIIRANAYLQQLTPQPTYGPQAAWQLELWTLAPLPADHFDITLDATPVIYPLPYPPTLTRTIRLSATLPPPPPGPPPVITVTPLTFDHYNSGALGIYVCLSSNPDHRYLAIMRDAAWGFSLGSTGGGGPSNAVAQVYSSIWQSPGDYSFTIDVEDTLTSGAPVVATQTFTITAV